MDEVLTLYLFFFNFERYYFEEVHGICHVIYKNKIYFTLRIYEALVYEWNPGDAQRWSEDYPDLTNLFED